MIYLEIVFVLLTLRSQFYNIALQDVDHKQLVVTRASKLAISLGFGLCDLLGYYLYYLVYHRQYHKGRIQMILCGERRWTK